MRAGAVIRLNTVLILLAYLDITVPVVEIPSLAAGARHSESVHIMRKIAAKKYLIYLESELCSMDRREKIISPEVIS